MADMGKDKGVLADLTSISKMLGTILTQIKDIKTEAGKASSATSAVTKGGGGGPKVKTGQGSSNLALADISTPANVPAMNGESQPATFGGEPARQQPVPSSKPNMPRIGSGMSLLKTRLSAAMLGIDIGAIMTKAAFGAMPDVQDTIQRGGSYYTAALTQGNRFSSMTMQNAAKASGLYATGMSGQIVDYMSQMGVNFSSAPNSSFMQKSAVISNATQYLNMDPMAAAQAALSLNSGAGSANMLRNFGIYTSDPRTGKEYTQQQIFEQLDQRLTAGRGKASVEDVNTSFYRGNLGETLRQSGMDQGTIEMFRQYEVSKAGGKPLNLNDTASVKQKQAEATAAGNENPMSSLYKINTSQESLQSNYQNDYVTGIKAAADSITTLNTIMEGMPDLLKQTNGYLATIAGNKGTGAILTGITSLIGSIGSFVTSLMNGKLLGNILKTISSGGGGGPEVSLPGGTKGLPGVKLPGVKASPLTTALKAGSKALPVASAVIEAASSAPAAWQASAQGQDLWSAISGKFDSMALGSAMAIGAGTGALVGAPAFGVGAGVGAVAGGAIGGLTYLAGNVGGSLLGWAGQQTVGGGAHGGVDSRVGTGASTPTGGKPSFIMPANGPLTDGFGHRSVESTGGRGSTYHHGIDIGVGEGSTVIASAAGVVTNAGWSDAVGNNIAIDHGSGYVTKYFHMSQLGVSVGARVQQGQRLGASGQTGSQCFGPHLHFQVEYNGTPIDPMTVLGGAAVLPVSNPQGKTQNYTSPGRATPSSRAEMLAGVAAHTPGFASVGGLSGASAATVSGGGKGSVTNYRQMVSAGSRRGGTSERQSGMSLPGAPSAKTGDSYVAQDGPVNVHTGEAILTAEQADVWRDAIKKSYGGGKGGGANVTINVSVAQASQAEAKKFAEFVKTYLEEDNLMNNMGRK